MPFSVFAASHICAIFPTVVNDNDSYGKVSGTANNLIGQNFTVASDCYVTAVGVNSKASGSPSNSTVFIYSDSAGQPSSSLEQGTGISSFNTTTFTWATSTFAGTTHLSAGTTYYVVEGQVTPNNTNFFFAGLHSPQDATLGRYRTNVSGTWATAGFSDTMLFEVDGNASAPGGAVPVATGKLILFGNW